MTECRLIHDNFSVGIQFILFALGIITLVLKWTKERYKGIIRNKVVWSYDVSKQLIGNLLAHLCNIVISVILTNLEKSSDQCVWYFINYTIDTVIGVFLLYLHLKLILGPFIERNKYVHLKCFGEVAHYQSGYYGDQLYVNRVSLTYWTKQLMLYCTLIIYIKLILLLLLVIIREPIHTFGEWIIYEVLVIQSVKFELTFVMIIWPCLLNCVQYYIQDNILMRNPQTLADQLSDPLL